MRSHIKKIEFQLAMFPHCLFFFFFANNLTVFVLHTESEAYIFSQVNHDSFNSCKQ